MPKYFQVSEDERLFVKKSIEEKYDIKIVSTNDCKLLSEIIFKEVNVLISYNTLRRFFNILSSSNLPSSYTINLLSNLVGFPDFISLREYRINSNRDFIHENLHLFHFSDNINTNIVNEIIPLLSENHWENIYQIRSLIDLFIKKDKIELISIFLEKVIDEQDGEKLYKYYVAFQPIHIAAKAKNEMLINFIKQYINKSKIVQQVLLQLYVEEDFLGGYYGDWINECTKYLTADMEIFHTCIKIQYHYIKKEINLSKENLDKLNIQVKNYSFKIHPIILGRIAAWNFIISNDSSFLKRYMVMNSDVLENITTITFFYKLVYLYGTKLQFTQYDYITLLQTENLQYSKMSFNIKTELSMYFLMLTRYYVEVNEMTLALKTIKKIDKRYQFSCSANFFEREYKLLYSLVNIKYNANTKENNSKF